ncbi:FadR/GntR family transcriptional regulator [Azohydromonas lata]|uniref:FadR/GntR family transcriptional regulator n=1 Tax=Azohydromonas lata TaxID=45677 RepID=UPI0008339A3C|nr:FadR/GntR family transcriptional regulator [Azohydromonas lata]
MTTKSPAPRATFQEQVLEQLGRDICSGRYKPGVVLPPEGELCERFAFSRIVIREAVKSLSAKGMLDVRRKVGTVVLDPRHWNLFDPDVIAWRAQSTVVDPAMTRDLMELRRIVEPAAARLAARRATGQERQALRSAYAAMERAVAGDGDYVTADLAFHATVLSAAGNQFVRQMQEAMNAILKASFRISSEKPGGPAFTLPMHEALCQAIEEADEKAAELASLRLIEQAEADLLEQLQIEQHASDQVS